MREDGIMGALPVTARRLGDPPKRVTAKSACGRRACRNYGGGGFARRAEVRPMLAQQTALLHHLRRLIAPRAAEADSDADLMARFIARRDEAAFADLVARHGPMILRL